MEKQKLTTYEESNENKANLIWDEYKYRHDLIWKHMIRSTVAVIAAITLPFINKFNWEDSDSAPLILKAISISLIIYVGLTAIIINKEIRVYNLIKGVHRNYQLIKHNIHRNERNSNLVSKIRHMEFQVRVNLFLLFLFTVAIFSCCLLFKDLENETTQMIFNYQ